MQIEIDGISTNYEELNPNQTKTLVILPGWGSSLNLWLPVTKLIRSDTRIIILDLPGFGSSKPFPYDPEISDFTNFLHKLFRQLGLRDIILLGHSFGGQLAFDYSLKYPDDIKSFILISPAIVRDKLKFIKLKTKIAEKIKPIISNAKSDIEKYLGWDTPDTYPNPNAYQVKVLNKILTNDFKPFLNQITKPSDIIWGSADFFIPNIGETLVTKIPNSKLHVIPGANHLIFQTHPKELASLINQILTL